MAARFLRKLRGNTDTVGGRQQPSPLHQTPRLPGIPTKHGVQDDGAQGLRYCPVVPLRQFGGNPPGQLLDLVLFQGLEHIGKRTAFHRSAGVFKLRIRGNHYKQRARAQRPALPNQVDSGQIRHSHVSADNIRFLLDDTRHGLAGVRKCPYVRKTQFFPLHNGPNIP